MKIQCENSRKNLYSPLDNVSSNHEKRHLILMHFENSINLFNPKYNPCLHGNRREAMICDMKTLKINTTHTISLQPY